MHSPEFQEIAAAQSAFLAAYRGAAWDAAEPALARLRAAGGRALGGLCDVYAKRLAHFRAVPPPSGWDGVYTAEEK